MAEILQLLSHKKRRERPCKLNHLLAMNMCTAYSTLILLLGNISWCLYFHCFHMLSLRHSPQEHYLLFKASMWVLQSGFLPDWYPWGVSSQKTAHVWAARKARPYRAPWVVQESCIRNTLKEKCRPNSNRYTEDLQFYPFSIHQFPRSSDTSLETKIPHLIRINQYRLFHGNVMFNDPHFKAWKIALTYHHLYHSCYFFQSRKAKQSRVVFSNVRSPKQLRHFLTFWEEAGEPPGYQYKEIFSKTYTAVFSPDPKTHLPRLVPFITDSLSFPENMFSLCCLLRERYRIRPF